MTNPRPLRVLLLCNYRPHEAAMVSDHIFALHHFSRHQVFVHTTLVQNQGQLDEDIDLNMFDVVVVHYSIALAIDAYINHHSLLRLGAFEGLKV